MLKKTIGAQKSSLRAQTFSEKFLGLIEIEVQKSVEK